MVRGDMCAFGMTQEDGNGKRLVMKPTGFMTNTPAIAEALSEKCDGQHQHIRLVGGRASRAEVYPHEMCLRIFKGLIEQMKKDYRMQEGCIGSVMREEEYETSDYMKQAWDDVTGEELDQRGVSDARKEEVQGIRLGQNAKSTDKDKMDRHKQRRQKEPRVQIQICCERLQ